MNWLHYTSDIHFGAPEWLAGRPLDAMITIMTTYRDPKRYRWLLSLVVPASLATAPLGYLWTGQAWRLWIPFFAFYLLVPLLDAIIG